MGGGGGGGTTWPCTGGEGKHVPLRWGREDREGVTGKLRK